MRPVPITERIQRKFIPNMNVNFMISLFKACRQRYAYITRIADKAKKTTRVQEEILKVAMEMSSISASSYLRNHGIEVSKSVICELVKKTTLPFFLGLRGILL